jgi:hypothetical protein
VLILAEYFSPVLILKVPYLKFPAQDIDRRYPQNPGMLRLEEGVGLPRGVGEQAPYASNEVLPDSAGALGGAAISGYAEIGHSDPAARWRSSSQ